MSASKKSPDGADEALMPESKGEQSTAAPTHQSVGLLAGTAWLMKRAVATADRYKQFIDADVDTEAALITASDCDADADESNDADESKLSHQSQPDFQYTELDSTSHHSKIPVSHAFVPATVATTTTTSTVHQSAFQSRKTAADYGHDRHAVRQRPAKPEFSAHTSTANPFCLGKIMPPSSSYDAGSSVASSSASSCCDKVDVFGAAPFHKKVPGTVENKAESADNEGELDVFANVPFVRQQERVAKTATSVSPTAMLYKAAAIPNSALSSDGGSYNTFSHTDSYNASTTSSSVFHHGSSGPTSVTFIPTESVSSGSGQVNINNQPCNVETQEMGVYGQDTGPLIASLASSVSGKSSHAVHSAKLDVAETISDSSKPSLNLPVLPLCAGQSCEEPPVTEECHGSGSVKKGWLAKLRSDKESPTTAVANLGFSDDPDAVLPMSELPSATCNLSFHEGVLGAMVEPKSPPTADESNFLLPSGAGSHTLPKVVAKKHLSHQHHLPPMSPESDPFYVTKKGIALL